LYSSFDWVRKKRGEKHKEKLSEKKEERRKKKEPQFGGCILSMGCGQ